MLRFQELLVDKRLFEIFFIELRFIHIFKKVLVQVLHHAVLAPFSIQRKFFILVHLPTRRKHLIKLLSHFSHQVLHVSALLFSVDGWLHNLGQS